MAENGRPTREDAKRVRALVVEDEFLVSLSLKLQLESVGCEVVGVAPDADSAVRLAAQVRPDVVLMDIGLPGKDGVEATREILEQVATRIIIVTAYGDDRVEGALAAGASISLTKPVLEEELARAVAQVTRADTKRTSGLRAGEA